jgi:hypothetical protein
MLILQTARKMEIWGAGLERRPWRQMEGRTQKICAGKEEMFFVKRGYKGTVRSCYSSGKIGWAIRPEKRKRINR